MRDMRTLFSDGSSVITIRGDHLEILGALSPEQVLRIMNTGKEVMEVIAQECGYVNTDCANFYTVFVKEWDERGDDYDPYNVSHDVFYLKAVMKSFA